MAYTTIDKPSEYFNTKLYTGNGSTQSIDGINFQPDWVWLKGRSGSDRDHLLFDILRDATNYIKSNADSAEATISSTLTSFDSDGFSIGSNGGVNTNSETYVSWNWLANGSGVSNTDGDITSTVSANTTSGFSIVTYTGTGSVGTIGHGLSAVPKMIIVKRLDSASSWSVYHSVLGNANQLYLNTKDASTSSTGWNSTDPTSSVFSIGSTASYNGLGNTYIAYCFADVQGYSKFGGYTGNGNADGTFVYTGFKPAFVLLKQSHAVRDWSMKDNKRPGYNVTDDILYPNLSDAEGSGGDIDIVSNGFKIRTTAVNTNENGGSYIYMAFAEEPLVSSSGVPCTAR